ncbi:MAG: hypothetical protein WCK47_01495 [bacterium]|nr:hypothetical protein [Candidatus Sumerlaeota bacterium]
MSTNKCKSFPRRLQAALVAVAIASCFGTSSAQSPSPAGKGIAAISQSAATGKYAFVFFYREGGSLAGRLFSREKTAQTEELRAMFRVVMGNMATKADAIEVNAGDPAEKDIVQQYDVSRAPMPLVLAIAPNGAITRGFPGKFTEQDLMNAFATPVLEKCLKVLQNRGLVLLCIQNAKTRLNEAAMKGVTEFKADPRFGQAVEIVKVDPSDTAESKLLNQFKVDPNTKDAMTVILAPPGSVLASFVGPTDKDVMIAKVTSSVSGCGSSCAPGQCGPAK